MKRLVFIIGLMLLTGCRQLVTPPEVTFRDLKITGAGTDGVNFDIDLTVRNPNSFALTLEGYTYRVRVMDLPLTTGGVRDTFSFEPHQENDLRIPVHIGYRDMLEIVRHRPDPDRIPYQFSAGLEVNSRLGRMYIPVEKGGTFAIPQQFRPSFYLDMLRNLLPGTEEQEPEQGMQ
jgi:LEA14-like dessication related protein